MRIPAARAAAMPTMPAVAATADPAPAPPAPAPPAPAPSPIEQQIAAAVTAPNVMAHITKLASTPRAAGSNEYLAAANYVAEQARAAGFEAKVVQHAGSSRPLFNVVADRRGTAPDADRKLVVGGAHLDSVPRAPGADDNASGSATLIESAKALNGIPTPNDLRLIWFDGEEQGLLGSRAYVRDYAGDLDRAVAMLNADMVGAPFGTIGFSMAPRTSSGVGDAIAAVAKRNGIAAEFRPERHNRSDHASFDRIGVPSADFGVSVRTVDREDPNYHSSRDTIDKINPKVVEPFADLFALSLYDFASRTKRITEPPPPKGLRPETGPPL